MNIIIRTPKFIGDTIMMLPALFLLQKHYKDADITIVCNSSFEAIFRGQGIKKFIIDDTKNGNRVLKTLKLIKKIKEDSYDLGILFHNSFTSALIFKLANIEKNIGYKKDGRGFLLDFSLKIDRSLHYTNHYCKLVNSFLNDKYKTIPVNKLYPQKQNFFKKNGKNTIGLLLGTDKGYRGYPKDLSLELCSLLNEYDYQIILLGDKADSKTNDLYEKSLKSVINLSGKSDLAQFIDIVNDLDLLVSIDTSAIHIASAVYTKFITLLGKGTSPFCVVKPKVDFGSYLFCAEHILIDSEQIRAITPKMIIEEIKSRLQE
jgi:heptosyltransferase-2